MPEVPEIVIGKGDKLVGLKPRYLNQHGLIAGATGTGKTVTAQVLAEGFSRSGVPVFMADTSGDLSGLSQQGKPHPKVEERVNHIGMQDYKFAGNSCVFWDIYGDKGHPVRATISDMGPSLLSILMGLNDTQQGILNIIFRFADDEGLLLLDLKDLRTILKFISDNAKQFRSEYGNISSASVAAIQRRLVSLEEDGIEEFFGEPKLDVQDFVRVDKTGCGNINVLTADKLILRPRLYASSLLWMLSELFEALPEVNNLEKPKFVFFIDEAHLLFDNTPQELTERVASIIKNMSSKGVGIFFSTHSPLDIPENVRALLCNRIQHAMRAFTPKDKKTVKSAAQTMRRNPTFDAEKLITELGVGEALVSTLGDDGEPSVVERTILCPPASRIGPASDSERFTVTGNSSLTGRYDKIADRAHAHDQFKSRMQNTIINQPEQPLVRKDSANGQQQSVGEALAKTVARSFGFSTAGPIARGTLGSLLGEKQLRKPIPQTTHPLKQ